MTKVIANRTLPFLDLAIGGGETDKRLLPVRGDLAAAELEGLVPARRFEQGTPRRVAVAATRIYQEPKADGAILNELLIGETFFVYDKTDGWVWGQSATDGYVGYCEAQAFAAGDDHTATHRVAQPSTLLFPEPSLKTTPIGWLPSGGRICLGETRDDGRFARVGELGWVVASHCRPLAEREPDPVLVARQFIGAPYLWGGRTFRGLDCSALIQLAFDAAGIVLPRDTDQQERWTAGDIDTAGPLARGDVVFFEGHVGIMEDGERLLHANAHHMAVVSEPLAAVIDRLGGKAAKPVTSIARII